jgi:hypothetical protein
VAQAYSGADGDGNSLINSDDYTVWRSHFGNTSPGGGSAAQALDDDPVRSELIAAPSGGADATALAFAALATTPVIRSTAVGMIRADQSVSTDEAASPDLLLVIGDVARGLDEADENTIGSSALEPADARVLLHCAFELLVGELEAPRATSQAD